MQEQSKPPLERLWAKVRIGKPDECWPFIGAVNRHGYGRIGVGTREQGTTNAHRLVLELIVGPPAEGEQARHLCGNRDCCNPAHLAWGDQSANEMDKVSHGRSNRGARHGHAKLDEIQVREIRLRLKANESMHVIARDYPVTWQSIQDIAHRRTWAWLDSEGGDAE